MILRKSDGSGYARSVAHMETRGIEPLTSTMPLWRSPS